MKYLFLFLPLFVYGCASSDVSVYEKAKIKAVKKWGIGFAYERRVDETTVKNTGELKERSVQYGRGDAEWQFRDDVYFWLKDHYYVTVTNDSAADGLIRLHPIYGYEFESCDITFHDRENRTLARIRVSNGHKDPYRFAQYAADAIGKMLEEYTDSHPKSEVIYEH